MHLQSAMTTTSSSNSGDDNASSTAAVIIHSPMFSRSTTTSESSVDNADRGLCELLRIQSSALLQRSTSLSWTEVDAVNMNAVHQCTVGYYEICSTALSIVLRALGVYINIRLAYDYYQAEQYDYYIWTTICIAVPMCLTTLIYANMCHQDGKFSKGTWKTLQTLWLVFLSSFLFRYWMSLIYSIKCKRAELLGKKEAQLKYYKRTVREESDVAFIRLFECFLEAAPLKILQISIVLGHIDKMTNIQTIAICSYFTSMAWCLAAYHRTTRYAQIDKQNISVHGMILQLCWHFCISVSRTLCIAFVASIFPIWTILGCLSHALLLGFVTFIVDRPKFVAISSFLNLLFCFILGIVYLFTYISVRDAPTRYKYILYYSICIVENVACVTVFMFFAANNLVSLTFLFYVMCVIALAFYFLGIVFSIIYYLYFHPKITARNSKRIINNN